MAKSNSPFLTGQSLWDRISTEAFSRIVKFAACFVLGGSLAWSMLQPLDSTSVFTGDAQPQNLTWLLLAVLVSLGRGWSKQSPAIKTSLFVLMALMIAWLAVVTLNAGLSCNPRTGWNGFWHLVGLFAFFFSARELLIDQGLRAGVLVVLIAGATALSIIGLYQISVEFPAQRDEYRRAPEVMLAELGIETHEGSPQRMRFESRLNSPEPLATFALTNSLAVLLAGVLVIALPLAIFQRRMSAKTGRPGREFRPTPRPWSGGAILTFIALVVIVLLLTRSRIAYLSLGLVILAYSAIHLLPWMRARDESFNQFGRSVSWLVVALFLLPLAISVPVVLLMRQSNLISGALQSVTYRIEYWTATLKMIGQHALLGIGLGNFQSHYPNYMSATASETVADPHNWILDLAITCSIPFAAITIAGVLLMLWTGIRSDMECPKQRPRGSAGYAKKEKSPRYFFAGAVTGTVMLLLFQAWIGVQINVTLVACLIAGLVVLPLYPQIVAAEIRMSGWATWAVIAMLICLTASGSWQSPGIVIPLLCLLCCQTPLPIISDAWRPEAGSSQFFRKAAWESSMPFGFFLVTLVAFLWQSWNPVLLSSVAGMQPTSNLSEQLRAVETARRLDPLDAQWDRYRIDVMVRQLEQTVDPGRIERLAEEIAVGLEEWTIREPVSFLTWKYAGQRTLDLASAVRRANKPHRVYIERAKNYFEQSVNAFPSNIQLRIQLAATWMLLDDLNEAQKQLEMALELDRITPHADRQLKNQFVWLPFHDEGFSAIKHAGSSWSRAELVVNWIRSRL
jgi:O-antigen ligase